MTTPNKNGNGIAQANGNGKTAETPVRTLAVANTKPGEEKTNTPAPSVEGKKLSDLPPLEDRLHRLNQLFGIQGKYNRLQSSLQKLKSFELSKEEEGCSISFTDKNRNSFSTTNPELMPEFLNFLKSSIQKKIKELEPLLKW